MRVNAPGTTPKSIWDYTTAAAIIAGTLGKLLTDNVDGKISLAKADVSTLETRLSASRATKLDNLDNIDASLNELFYEHFATTVDDLADVTTSGDATNPAALVDNNLVVVTGFASVDKYIDIDLDRVAYIKKIRHYGHSVSHANNRYRLQAYIEGAWEDCLVDIVDRVAASWSAWLDLTTPRASRLWRWQITTFDTQAQIGEVELHGVTVG